MLVDEDELTRRRGEAGVAVSLAARGWAHLYQQHVLQADRRVDLNMLGGGIGHEVPLRPN